MLVGAQESLSDTFFNTSSESSWDRFFMKFDLCLGLPKPLCSLQKSTKIASKMDVEKVTIFDRFWNLKSTYFQTSSTCKNMVFAWEGCIFFNNRVSKLEPWKTRFGERSWDPILNPKMPSKSTFVDSKMFFTQAHTHFCSENAPRRMKDLALATLIFA